MPELNTNTLVLLVLIVAIVLFDFFRRRKSDSKELMDIPRQSNKKRLFIRFFLLLALGAITFFLLNREDSKSLDSFEIDLPIEEVNDELSGQFDSRIVEVNKELSALGKLTERDFYSEITPLFEKYYDCLECIEAISLLSPGGSMTKEFARFRIQHFSRAIDLGSNNIEIYTQDMRYKLYVKDKYGAIKRDKEIQNIIENLDKIPVYSYSSIGTYYLLKSSVYDIQHSLSYSHHLDAIKWYGLALDALNQERPSEIKKKVSNIANKMRFYSGSFNYYGSWVKDIPVKDREELCKFMSRLGSMGGEDIYELIQKLCAR